MKRIMYDSLRIPVTADNEPDWAFMDSFMLDIMSNASVEIDFLSEVV